MLELDADHEIQSLCDTLRHQVAAHSRNVVRLWRYPVALTAVW